MYFLGDCELWSWWCKFLWQSVPGAWSPLFQLRLCVEQAPVAELKGTWACILLKDDFFVWCLSGRWKRICDAVWTTIVTAVLWVLLFLTSRCSVRVAWKCPVWTCRSYSGEPPQFHHRWVARCYWLLHICRADTDCLHQVLVWVLLRPVFRQQFLS